MFNHAQNAFAVCTRSDPNSARETWLKRAMPSADRRPAQ
jgi:hypothetical protein